MVMNLVRDYVKAHRIELDRPIDRVEDKVGTRRAPGDFLDSRDNEAVERNGVTPVWFGPNQQPLRTDEDALPEPAEPLVALRQGGAHQPDEQVVRPRKHDEGHEADERPRLPTDIAQEELRDRQVEHDPAEAAEQGERHDE